MCSQIYINKLTVENTPENAGWAQKNEDAGPQERPKIIGLISFQTVVRFFFLMGLRLNFSRNAFNLRIKI
jgi:hypothetical protein